MSDKPQRLVIDARESGTSTGRYIDKLIEYLYKLKPDFEITIVTKKPRLDYFKKIAPDFKTVATPYSEFSLGEQLGFKKQLQCLRPDLVHFGMVQQPLLYRGRTVTTMHDLTTARFSNPLTNPIVFKLRQTVYKFVNWYVPRKSERVFTPTEFVKRDVMHYAHLRDTRKFVVTYEAADNIKDTSEALQNLNKHDFIMYTGRPQPHKNLDRLIEAFTELQLSHPDLKLVLVGKQDELYRRYQAKVKADKIKGVIFTGFVSEGELRWLYEHCLSYVAPSLSEGFGLPGLEAMQHGAPVVSSNATCLPEVYDKGAAYFDPYDVKDMAQTITQVIDDPRYRQQLVESGRKQAAKYSWLKTAKETLAVYREVLKH